MRAGKLFRAHRHPPRPFLMKYLPPFTWKNIQKISTDYAFILLCITRFFVENFFKLWKRTYVCGQILLFWAKRMIDYPHFLLFSLVIHNEQVFGRGFPLKKAKVIHILSLYFQGVGKKIQKRGRFLRFSTAKLSTVFVFYRWTTVFYPHFAWIKWKSGVWIFL